MKASDLRIGNWVLFTDYPTKRNAQISGNDIAQLDNDPKRISNFFQPIPLTEEWLLKFGFENPSEQYFSKGKCAVFQHKNGDFELTLGRGLSAPFKYVHQLQNLYFALTGEELTIQSNE